MRAVAVLTAIDERDAVALLAAYGLGPPNHLEGIAAGSVNSNFAVVSAQRRLFVRLYEERDRAAAERETEMLEALARAGVPTPAPLRRSDGGFVSEVRGKPAAIFPWVDGRMRCQSAVSEDDARAVGAALARVHVAARAAADRGRFRFEDLLGRLDRIEASGDERFAPLVPSLRSRLERTHRSRDARLPRALVHTDLFRDNVLWDDRGDIVALLDFESACDDTFAYDLMVTVLSWCFGDSLHAHLATAMRGGYERVRRLTEDEKRGMLAEGKMASLRFTITRITDYAMRTGAAGPRVVKDWRRFLARYEDLDALGARGLARILGL